MGASAAAALLVTLILGNGPAPDVIRARVLAFYRDDRAHRWPDVLDHFTVGKIAARWPAPSDDPAWTRATPPDGAVPCVSSRGDAPSRMSIDVVGRWARVFVTWCDTGSTGEVWLLRIAEEWKIARLTRDVPRLDAYRAPFAPC
jgi:hypothetical protein